ncbi:MAG TPA: tripartite tricarboxylate transporter substrate binding protein [Xanthobacteraceae bacterium]|nr:tripartite tricarboxylate transporter substrate binding protein [Xanthobacteraceae bacterium]
MAASIGRCAAIAFAALACATLSPTAHAQDFPSKPVHLLVPFPPGGAVDIMARTLADELGKRWPANIIIDNRPGAGGTIAADAAAKAPPDGYTLVIVASGHAIVPFLYPRLPYDVFADFTPITLLGNSPNLALVRADSPIKTLAELIEAARAKPGQLSYGHAGNGTSPHLAGELLKVTAKIDITAVPYKGGAPALNDLLGGHIPLTFNNVPESIAQIRSGALRPLAVTTAKRTPILPDVPTFDESGVKGYDTGVWWALLAPAGLPADVKTKIYRDAADAMKSTAVKERVQTLGAVPIGSTPEELVALIRADYEKWGPIIKAAGVVAE